MVTALNGSSVLPELYRKHGIPDILGPRHGIWGKQSPRMQKLHVSVTVFRGYFPFKTSITFTVTGCLDLI